MIPELYSTKDYSIFKTVKFNRDINKKHVEEIKSMIVSENLLHLHPIIVNDQMEVIDGQHRLIAAKELDLPIFYFKENISYEHILNSNLVQKKLQLKDAIKYYAYKDELSDYIEFQSYLVSLELNPKALFGLLFGNTSAHMIKFIKSGKFRMPPDKEKTNFVLSQYLIIKNFSQEKKIKPYSMFTSHTFTIGFRNLVLIPSYNENVFVSKINQRWFEIKPQIDATQWTKSLISIYNWKNQNQIEIE